MRGTKGPEPKALNEWLGLCAALKMHSATCWSVLCACAHHTSSLPVLFGLDRTLSKSSECCYRDRRALGLRTLKRRAAAPQWTPGDQSAMSFRDLRSKAAPGFPVGFPGTRGFPARPLLEP